MWSTCFRESCIVCLVHLFGFWYCWKFTGWCKACKMDCVSLEAGRAALSPIGWSLQLPPKPGCSSRTLCYALIHRCPPAEFPWTSLQNCCITATLNLCFTEKVHIWWAGMTCSLFLLSPQCDKVVAWCVSVLTSFHLDVRISLQHIGKRRVNLVSIVRWCALTSNQIFCCT